MGLFSTQDISCPTLPKSEVSFDTQSYQPTKVSFGNDDNLSEVISKLIDGEFVQFWTKGRWSMHQLIKHVCELVGECDVTLCTWAITEEPLRVIHNLKTTGKIKTLRGLFEHKVKSRGSAYAFAEQFFDEIFLSKCHAKVTVIEGNELSVTIMCSANLTKNRRIEAGTMYVNKEAAIQNRKYILNATTN